MKKNNKTLLTVLLIVVAMVGLSYAAVPLYDMFCRITGYGGTTQVAESYSGIDVIDRDITIRFDSNIDEGLPWDFKPVQKSITLKIGENTVVYYTAKNISEKPTTGMATFNVTPAEAGSYFNKIQCFCFNEQTLQPGEEVKMPVQFFVDPEIVDDPNIPHLKEITLSYTFFEK